MAGALVIVRCGLIKSADLWASEAFGIEVTLGVMPSADVAAPRANRHDAAPLEREPPASVGICFKALPTTPAAEMDLALLVPDGVDAATVEQALRSAGGELLEQVSLLDLLDKELGIRVRAS